MESLLQQSISTPALRTHSDGLNLGRELCSDMAVPSAVTSGPNSIPTPPVSTTAVFDAEAIISRPSGGEGRRLAGVVNRPSPANTRISPCTNPNLPPNHFSPDSGQQIPKSGARPSQDASWGDFSTLQSRADDIGVMEPPTPQQEEVSL